MGVDVAFLHKVITVGLIKQVISEQNLDGSKVNCLDSVQKKIPGRGDR